VRVEGHIYSGNAAAGYETIFWDIAQGAADLNGKLITGDREVRADAADPDPVLDRILNRDSDGVPQGTKGTKDKPKRIAWVLRDYPAYLNGPNAAATLRRLRNLVNWLPTTPTFKAQAIIIISPSAQIPDELQINAQLTEWPLPDRAEIGELLQAAINRLPEEMRDTALAADQQDAAIDAAVGLSGLEAQATFAASLIKLRRIDPLTVSQEKKRLISQVGGLEWIDPPKDGMDAVGGLDIFKDWIVQRAVAFTPDAREYGLQSPKGVLAAGIPGCGKSLLATATGAAYGIPVLKVDLGALKGKYVGESEGNLRNTFKVAEAIGPCVLWFDEIEKALQGATGGAADGGVSSDVLGFLLNWMQERRGQAFVFATCNNAESLPPELIRKGRFDQVFWVDLPNPIERESVLEASLRKVPKRSVSDIDLRKVSEITEGFSGAEIAALVPDAMFIAYNDGKRPVTTEDLLLVRQGVTPLSSTKGAELDRLREKWASRMKEATTKLVVVDAAPVNTGASDLDLSF
jgi:ATP-dependent 26S proteasome regulatory subunit